MYQIVLFHKITNKWSKRLISYHQRNVSFLLVVTGSPFACKDQFCVDVSHSVCQGCDNVIAVILKMCH
jgi:hypothetical protein